MPQKAPDIGKTYRIFTTMTLSICKGAVPEHRSQHCILTFLSELYIHITEQAYEKEAAALLAAEVGTILSINVRTDH